MSKNTISMQDVEIQITKRSHNFTWCIIDRLFHYFIYVYALLLFKILLNVIITSNVLLNYRITRNIRECSYFFDYSIYINFILIHLFECV